MSTFDFDEELTQRLEIMYKTKDAIARRQAVLKALQLQPEEAVLDIGSGPGFVTFDMAQQVTSRGQVRGIDMSGPMIQLAQKRCADLPWVDIQAGNALELPFPDNHFDAVISVQVIEYIEDVKKALEEIHRVLKPGGRAIVVSTDWDALVWNNSNPERMQRVMSAFAAHCAHNNLPRSMPRRLLDCGFEIHEQQVINQFNPIYEADSYSYQIIPAIADFVATHGGINKVDAEAWAADLSQLGAQGDYFFSLNQYLCLISKP